jgi:hypothetical protein
MTLHVLTEVSIKKKLKLWKSRSLIAPLLVHYQIFQSGGPRNLSRNI